MNKYKKNLTDEDIQVLKNTMQKHNDIKSPMKLMAQSIVTEQEKGLLRLMYFRFTDYVNQKQRADELERKFNKEVEDSYQMENRWRTEIERADELEKRWSELKKSIVHMPCNQIGQISPRYIFDKIKQLEEDDNA